MRYVHFQPERNWKGYEMTAGIAWNNPNIGRKELEDFSRVYMFIWTRGGPETFEELWKRGTWSRIYIE